MEKYKIKNIGCDDTTEAVFELTAGQYEFLERIFETLNKQSTYGCMPKIYVEPYEDEGKDENADDDDEWKWR